MRSSVLVLAMLVGCRQVAGLDDPLPGDDVIGDANTDADADAPDDTTMGCWPYATSNVDPCDLGTADPAPDLSESGTEGYDFSTSTGQWRFSEVSIAGPSGSLVQQADGSMVRVLKLDGFDLPSGSSLEVTGSFPLVIVVEGNATVAGTIRVSAGRSPSGCGTAAAGADAATASGGGGGGGGGFGTAAAGGGTGGGGKAGGSGSGSSGDTTASPLRGGCDGASGGRDASGNSGGSRGSGGGALQLIVRDLLTISGSIDAGGNGGNGGIANINGGAGGGGGGSGGTVFLESHDLSIASTGRVCANGGAGGEGGGDVVGNAGDDGTCSATSGAMSSSNGTGGDGGTGGFASTTPTVGDNGPGATAGGGGGGGGVGRIKLHVVAGSTVNGTVTPAAQ